MDLEDFNTTCKLPHWAMLMNLANLNIKTFLLVLPWGNLGKSQATIGSIHFPSIHYFALFVGRCINGIDEACHMCVPDLSVLKSAVLGDKQYNLGGLLASII